ncbi:MAG: sterol desaturase/sphingolipid hydroxylase (fatty acid hydroxylase superfamily) [Porticoccus sp.]|jgi:sterol desaturase/sphingolipid hydroxylase (fatty acid hydroxylase superfamily)
MAELITYKSLIAGLFLLVLFIAERYVPAVTVPEEIVTVRRITNNLLLWLCNSLLSPVIILPVTLYAIHYGLSWRNDLLVGWGGLLLDILALDLWIYWWHRANHSIPLMWRFHRIHHLDRWLDVTSSVRFHFCEVILSALVRALVVVSLGIPLLSVIVFETLVLVNAGFHHSNIRLPKNLEHIVSKLIITPSAHWMHHHIVQQDTDSNYGVIFSFWDRLFGSQSNNQRTADMEIGLKHSQDVSLVQLMISPFMSR